MRCWAIVTAVALILLASVGRCEAVKLQGRKINVRVDENSSLKEHRSVEGPATSDSGEVPDPPAVVAARAAIADPAAVESSPTEGDQVGVAVKFNPHTAEARLVSEALKFVIPPEISLPYLPAINFMGLSLCLTKVRILGFDKYSVKVTDMVGQEKAGYVDFHKITLLADPYIAGGRLLNLPFVGQGAFNATALRLRIQVKFQRLEGTTYCPKPNSTVFTISVKHLIVKFEDLNPGSESGELINAMLGALGNDMLAFVSMAFNNETLLHPLADKIAVSIIGKDCFYASDAFDSETGNMTTKNVCLPENVNSCKENFEEGEDSSTSAGGEEDSSTSARGEEDSSTSARGGEDSSTSARGEKDSPTGTCGGEDSSTSARGANLIDLLGSENIEKSVNGIIRLVTASLADPLAEILEKSFNL